MQMGTLFRVLNAPQFWFAPRQQIPYGGITAAAGLKTSATVVESPKSVSVPVKPKRPVNAYIRFLQSIRPKLQGENPKASPTAISKLAATQWLSVDHATKTKLEEEFKRDQAVWLQKNAKYLSQLTDDQKQDIQLERQQKADDRAKREHRRKMKELGKPKRPMNSFLRYCADQKTQKPTTREETAALLKQMAQKWAKLGEAEKAPYNKASEADLKRYSEQLRLWEEKMIATENTEFLRKKSVVVPPAKARKPKSA